MEARWRQKEKGVVSAQVTVEYKEQSSGFMPEPASQRYAHKHVCTCTRVVGSMLSA